MRLYTILAFTAVWNVAAGRFGSITSPTNTQNQNLVQNQNGECNVCQTLSVTGYGKATAAPDMATFSVTVSKTAKEAKEALEYNNGNMTAVQEELLKADGIESEDIQTGHFSVDAVYEWVKGEEREVWTFVGYRVTHTVNVQVHGLEGLGAILDTVIGVGDNEISGIGFQIDDVESVMDEARENAVADAQRKADLYALNADVILGNVISISESSGYVSSPMFDGRYKAESLDSAVPIATGENEVSATVYMVYAITTPTPE
eukprot:scaffold1040_cov165-Amphora_coffeaeformis.AAC.4